VLGLFSQKDGMIGEHMIAGSMIARLLVAVAAVSAAVSTAAAQSGEPIRIGFGIAMTGSLAANGKSALLAQKIWEEDVNAEGGLLGRPVKLVYYDDQTNPNTVPGIYSKLLDGDKVDLIIGGYGTNSLAAAMPLIMERNKVFLGLLGLAVNSGFNYPNYFSINPAGPDAKLAFTKGFFDTAMAQNPKPQTVAIVGSDAEFSRNAAEGARSNARAVGLNIVYDNTYPTNATDFVSIVRAIQATNPDLVVICSYPLDSVGMVRAVNEVGLTPKMIGGAMVGLQAATMKMLLGPLINGFVNYEFWLPVPRLEFAGTAELMKKYQARALDEHVDALGYYMAPWGYAQLQVLQQAVQATKSFEDKKIGDYIRATTFKTVVGDIRFGAKGEWGQSRMLQAQFRNIKGNDLAQFRDMSTGVVVSPAEYATGAAVYPYERAKQ
jgi:branched-chain amino acid transport system substrate-binding protein